MEWNEHTQLRLQIDNLLGKIQEAFPHNNQKNGTIRLDLAHMWRNLNNQFKLLDQEAVECRRRNKPTSQYTELRASVDELIHIIDKRVTWGLML